MKFQKMPGLSEVPFEGHPLGQKIYESVSKEGWSMWLEHMKMLMNEYRLNLGTPEAQEFLIKQIGRLLLRRGLRASGGIRAAEGEVMMAKSHAAGVNT